MLWVFVGDSGGTTAKSTMNVEIPQTNIMEKKSDDRGRITLGSEFADMTVTVAVLETGDTMTVKYRQYYPDYEPTAHERQEYRREMHEVSPEYRMSPPGVSIEHLSDVRKIESVTPMGEGEPGNKMTLTLADGRSMQVEHADIISIEPNQGNESPADSPSESADPPLDPLSDIETKNDE